MAANMRQVFGEEANEAKLTKREGRESKKEGLTIQDVGNFDCHGDINGV